MSQLVEAVIYDNTVQQLIKVQEKMIAELEELMRMFGKEEGKLPRSPKLAILKKNLERFITSLGVTQK